MSDRAKGGVVVWVLCLWRFGNRGRVRIVFKRATRGVARVSVTLPRFLVVHRYLTVADWGDEDAGMSLGVSSVGHSG